MRLWTLLVLCSAAIAAEADAEPRRDAKAVVVAAARKAQPRQQKKAAPQPEKKAEPAPAAADGDAPIRRGERIEFDARLVQGQTARAGALYLFDRRPSDLKSMVKERESYRDEVVREIFPETGSDL